jgi:RNA polymerase-binding transcription factor DksA
VKSKRSTAGGQGPKKGQKKVIQKHERAGSKPGAKAAAASQAAPAKAAGDNGSAAKKPVEKAAPKPGPNAPVPALTEADLRKVKTGLTRKDLDRYRLLLLAKRGEILGDVDSLQTDRDSKSAGGGNLSNMPLHMADVGTENYEQEFTLHLVESERALLREINDALLRIKSGTFGVCLESGQPINRARLDAKPWAKYSIEVSREKERMRLPS